MENLHTSTQLEADAEVDYNKNTPGRHCELRIGCVDCLAVSYCLWSPSTNKCLDKAKLLPTDDAIATCDPVICAEHAKIDKRQTDVHEVELVNLNNDRLVTSEAEETNSPEIKPVLSPYFQSLLPQSNEADVVVAKGTVFVNDNSPSLLINGEDPIPPPSLPRVEVTACIHCSSLQNANPNFVAPEYQNLLGSQGLPAPIIVNGIHYQLPAGKTSGIAEPVPIINGVHPYFHVQP
jgi:hypothetical protein